MIPTGSRKIVVNLEANAAQVEDMRNGYRAITNPTLQEFNGFMTKEGGSHKARFVVDKDRGNVHFAHAFGSVHPDIIRHFGIGENRTEGFMYKGGMDQHYANGYEKNTIPFLKKYIIDGPTGNAIGFDGKHWPGRGEAEEDEDELKTPMKKAK